MNPLLESLQYVEDELLEEGSAPVRRGSPRRRWGALAACLAAVFCGGFLLRGVLGSRGESASLSAAAAPTAFAIFPEPTGYVTLPQYTEGSAGASQGGIRPTQEPDPGQAAGTPGDLTPPPERGEPEVFAYTVPLPSFGGDRAEVILVGQALTAEQVDACAPAIRREWMEDITGTATYRLADGSGGLYSVELSVPHEDQGNVCRVTLREATAEDLAAFGPEGDRLPTMNGDVYAAGREYYDRDGEERVDLRVVFVLEDVLYTLESDVPAGEEKAAAMDLRDLMLAYFGTHDAPDLGSFVYQK